MSNDYDNNMRIALFTNEDRGEKGPSLNGKLTVDNVDYEVSLWTRTSKAGKKYWSGEIQKEGAWKSRNSGEQDKSGASGDQPPTPDDDDVPF